MHTTYRVSPASTKPRRGPGSFWHPAPWQHPWVGASKRFWSRKTKSQGGSKPTSNSEPPGFAPSTVLVLCNQQCHLGSHTGRVKGDSRADAMPPGAILSPAEPFQMLTPNAGAVRGSASSPFICLSLSLFPHLCLWLPFLGSHLRTTRRPRTSPITPRRQHYLLPTAGKRERETSWGFIRGQATAARGAAMPAAPPDPAQVKEIRETSISRAQRQNPAFAFESIIYSSCFIIAEPSIDGGLWRGHSWSNNNNNKKYLSRRRILYEFIIRQGDAFFLAKVFQRK